MSEPLISVIIPTYNYDNYIKQAIDSILAQTYPKEKIEIIVVDDGSTDNTYAVLQELINEKAIQYYYQENKGKANATYNAIQKCNGKYIFNLDADDYFLQDKITEYVKVFEENDEIVHVAAPAKILFEETQFIKTEILPKDILGKVIDGKWLLHRFYNDNMLFGGGTTYAARSSALKTIKIPSGVDMYIDEFLILTILPLGKSFFFDHPLSVWRIHKYNFSISAVVKENQIKNKSRLINSSSAVLDYLQKHHFEKSILKIYQIQDLTRRMLYKELQNDKKLSDIFNYSITVFFKIRPNWRLIKKYNLLNRLIPLSIIHFIKRNKPNEVDKEVLS
ncbi:glycosyltransferase family 2 protein [Mucilaginibacter arboris]|uniref:Glycosyltransferase n=1 Tax=Mucilaginibacter arboris TaxID=2682090 RepID=A0A7K1SY27_9SPHI|nr:glycosyltransferase family A protein [Mucilaginibacter arboris]MVN22225.1 glycosyltransferase [Mucilaginibacter arboris]